MNTLIEREERICNKEVKDISKFVRGTTAVAGWSFHKLKANPDATILSKAFWSSRRQIFLQLQWEQVEAMC